MTAIVAVIGPVLVLLALAVVIKAIRQLGQ
mgnify:CR=1 FL=1